MEDLVILTLSPSKQEKNALGRTDIGIIIIIGTVGFLLRLISFFFSTGHDADVRWFIKRSTWILRGRVSYRDFSDPKPLWTNTLAAWFSVVGVSVENLFLLLIAVDVFAILFMFFVGKDVLGKKEGYFASMFYAFNPFTIFFSSADGKMDAIPVLFIILALWSLKKRKIDLSAIFLGIGIMYKYLAGLYLIPFLFLIKKSGNRTSMIIKYVIVCAATCAFIALPFLLVSPSRFITDTLLFFFTKEMGQRQHELHPYNFLPFYVPLIFVLMAWIGILFLAAAIDNFKKSDELRTLFFFIMFTVLLNRSVYTQYFMYTIPILGLIFAQDLIKGEGEQLSISWVTISACAISVLLGIELLSNFGVTEQTFLSLLGYNLQSYKPLSFIIFIASLKYSVLTHHSKYLIQILGLIFTQGSIKGGGEQLSFLCRAIAAYANPLFPMLELLNNLGMESSPFPFLVGDWIGDMHTLTYCGIFFFTLVLFIDWIRTLKSENRLQLSEVLKKSPFSKFLKNRFISDSNSKAKTNPKQKNNG